VGRRKHKFIAGLISPNFPALEEWARQQESVLLRGASWWDHPEVIARYQAIIDDETNASLAHFETIKRFKISSR